MNYNEQKIEEVLSRKAAIQYDYNDLTALTLLLRYLFPKDDKSVFGTTEYYYTNTGEHWQADHLLPAGMKSYPLSSFIEEHRTPKVHYLKTWPEFFQKVKSGEKPFEIRKNDRDIRANDILVLQEWKPMGFSAVSPNERVGEYTGDEIVKEVSYVLTGGQFGVESGYDIFGLKNTTPLPAEQPQAKYVEIIENTKEDSKPYLTIGKIYKVLDEDNGRYLIVDDEGDRVKIYKSRTKPSTEALYLLREQPTLASLKRFESEQPKAEVGFKVNQWVWKDKDKQLIAMINRVIDGNTLLVDNQNGYVQNWSTQYCVLATPEEVFNWLKLIAESKYPVGTEFKSLKRPELTQVAIDEFYFIKGELICNAFTIWKDGKWAEIVSPECTIVEERWKPKYNDRYYYVQFAGRVLVGSYTWKDQPIDEGYYASRNCYKTEEQAEIIKEKIENILKENVA